MSKAQSRISIEKSAFTLNLNGTKVTLSIEELRTLQGVINQKLNGYYSPYTTTTTVPLTTNNASFLNTAQTYDLVNSSLTGGITIGESNE
jgi:hypothetical protein